MKTRHPSALAWLLSALLLCGNVYSQPSTGTISGKATDENGSVLLGASVLVKNIGTGLSRISATNSEGRFRFESLPIGHYEITIEAPNFSKHVRSGIDLVVNQNAVVDATLKVGSIQEIVNVNENASLLNTSTAEVSTRFDTRRLSELPIAPNRNVMNVVLSVAGVNQLVTGQAELASGLSYSANGGRLRSNNFMLDGQDMNDVVFTGGEVALNNPDAFQEVQIITNQFRAEYGRNSGSVVNFIGKAGTNEYHGSLFWFHNNEYLNTCSNLDKVASGSPTGFCNKAAVIEARKQAPRRRENQIGFTLGGPFTFPSLGDGNDPRLWKGIDRTFFFADYQRWADRALVAGPTLSGAPTAEGRAVLQSVAMGRPHVQALLDSVPAGVPNGRFARFTIPGQPELIVPLGDLTSSAPFVFDSHQGSVRLDHRFNKENLLYGRYRFDSAATSGAGQVTPPGLTTVNSTSSHSVNVVLNTVLTNKISNEARTAWKRFSSYADAEYPISKTIPSIAVPGLGMIGAPSGRTAIGFSPLLPGGRTTEVYQIADAFSYSAGDHSAKLGAELRRTDTRLDVFLNTRGTLMYVSPPALPGAPIDISNFIRDIAQSATITLRIPGGDTVSFYRWWEFYAFAQDEWRVRDDLVVTFGARYEYSGDVFRYLKEVNQRVIAANGNNAAFRYAPQPKGDTKKLMPRLGFIWNPRVGKKGILGFVTGGDKLVMRAGYSRNYDANFINIPQNVARFFPFVANQNVSLNGAFQAIRNTTVANITQPNRLPRTIVSEDFRAPAADQFSVEVQRELTRDIVLTLGYIRTRGTRLMQTVDGNPCLPERDCRGSNFGNRVDPNLEAITLYTNAGSSSYDAMQVSLTKRLSRNLSAGLHYTWSTFIDEGSDVFAPSSSEISVAQNPFDRRSERARSSYDRPHRLTGNFVYELPFYRRQKGAIGRLLGGWQVNSFFTFQSGAPFSVTLGADPACAVCGIAATVRPNLNTNLDLSSMTIDEILAAGGANLFRGLFPGQRVGDAGRNILRTDNLKVVDFGFIKNTRLTEDVRVQLRADMFNAFNSRNFGIPLGTTISGLNFLTKWATDGGNRRIVIGARLVF